MADRSRPAEGFLARPSQGLSFRVQGGGRSECLQGLRGSRLFHCLGAGAWIAAALGPLERGRVGALLGEGGVGCLTARRGFDAVWRYGTLGFGAGIVPREGKASGSPRRNRTVPGESGLCSPFSSKGDSLSSDRGLPPAFCLSREEGRRSSAPRVEAPIGFSLASRSTSRGDSGRQRGAPAEAFATGKLAERWTENGMHVPFSRDEPSTTVSDPPPSRRSEAGVFTVESYPFAPVASRALGVGVGPAASQIDRGTTRRSSSAHWWTPRKEAETLPRACNLGRRAPCMPYETQVR